MADFVLRQRSNYELDENEFNEILKKNKEFIKSHAVKNPSLSKDDEWRKPNYSKYDKIK